MREQTEQQARFSFASLREKFLDALPYLVFFVLLFFTIYYLFGVADALLGIVFLFFSRAIIQDPGLSFANYLRRLCWFVLMGVCASIAGLNDVLFVVMSFCYLFFITLTQSDDYLPRNFYWLGLGYLFLLIYPITPGEILPRLAALGLSIALTTAFIYLMRFTLRKTGKLDEFARDRAFMREAFDDVATQLRLLAQAPETEPTNNTDPSLTDTSPSSSATSAAKEPQPSASTLEAQVEPERTFTLAQDYAQTEYATVLRQGGILSGRQCYTFALLLCCEQISDLIHATSKNAQGITPKNREYFADLAAVFKAVATKKITRISEIVSELEAFLERRGFDTTCYHESWNAILEALVRTLRDTRLSRDESTPFLKSIRYRYHFLRDNISLKNTQTRFSLQLATIVTIAVLADIALTHLIGLDFGIWIPIVAFTILNTYNDETLRSTKNSTIGTLVGIAIFALFVHFIPSPFLMPTVITLCYLVILMNISQTVSITAGTQMALTALYSADASLGMTLVIRLGFVIIAATCVVMVIFLFMRTQRTTTIRTKIIELERIDGRLLAQIDLGIKRGHVNLWRAVQLLYYLHMNSAFMENLANSLSLKEIKWEERPSRRESLAQIKQLKQDVQRVLQLNYKFAMDAAHAVMLLDPRRVHDDLLSDEPQHDLDNASPDTTARIKHIDATNERLKEKTHDLETMRYLEEDLKD